MRLVRLASILAVAVSVFSAGAFAQQYTCYISMPLTHNQLAFETINGQSVEDTVIKSKDYLRSLPYYKTCDHFKPTKVVNSQYHITIRSCANNPSGEGLAIPSINCYLPKN